MRSIAKTVQAVYKVSLAAQRLLTTTSQETRQMRILDEFPPVKGQTRYAWDEFLDGRPREFVVGEDFTSKVTTFRANAQTQAKKRGGRVRSRLLRDGERQLLLLQFVRN